VSPVALRRLLAGVATLAVVGSQVGLLASAAPAQDAPPATPVPPSGSLSPFPSVLRTPADPSVPPDVSARSAVLADLDSGALLYRRAADTPRPIASLTKVMTALIVLERTELDEVVRVDPRAVFEPDAYGASSTLGLRPGERIKVRDLLYALLLGSANDAALALAIHVSGSVDAFVDAMNLRAAKLGMRSTRFYSPSGLDDRGRSTARDLLILVRAAGAIPTFSRITATRFHTIPAPTGPPRHIQNRNALLWLYPGSFGTKTGTTFRAGPCVIASADRDGRQLVAIVLHAEREPFSDAAALLQYGFEGFERRVLVTEGEGLGSIDIRGGGVPVVAGEGLSALVPVRSELKERVRVDPSAAFPPVPGQTVATLTISGAGVDVGSVPLLVAWVPPPVPEGSPWWARAAASVARAATAALHALS
jgi:D-alanyl-D-alanine carboxypeptidase (penicillin-binding protein 5/6)